jgi:hypothetical protein
MMEELPPSVKVAEGFSIGMSTDYSSPYISDGSGNAYFVVVEKSSSLHTKAIHALLTQLYKEHSK